MVFTCTLCLCDPPQPVPLPVTWTLGGVTVTILSALPLKCPPRGTPLDGDAEPPKAPAAIVWERSDLLHPHGLREVRDGD